MVIHNATFMVAREREREFIDWFAGMRRQIALKSAGLHESESLPMPSHIRLSAMREAGGQHHTAADVASISFQAEFFDVEEALDWRRRVMSDVVDAFEAEFGPDAMVFMSVFEEV